MKYRNRHPKQLKKSINLKLKAKDNGYLEKGMNYVATEVDLQDYFKLKHKIMRKNIPYKSIQQISIKIKEEFANIAYVQTSLCNDVMIKPSLMSVEDLYNAEKRREILYFQNMLADAGNIYKNYLLKMEYKLDDDMSYKENAVFARLYFEFIYTI
uniref:Uncharacterized protein n=1 Tax=Faxonius propinquus nudivirus TaxID=3139431 RepID=A0AAU8GCW2_9VIRU